MVAPGQVKLRTMRAPALIYAAAMVPPYFFCAFLLLRDLLAQIDCFRWRAAAVVATCILQIVFDGPTAMYMAGVNLEHGSNGALGYAACFLFGCLFLVPCLAAAAAASLRRGSGKTHVSRVALLYERYMGLRGLYYRWKILGLQYVTVLLQAGTKLPELGALVWTQSHFQDNALVDLKGAPSAPAFWFFVIMISFNAVYPGALYYYAARRSSVTRNADTTAALCDVTLDLAYSIGWIFVTKQFLRFCRWTPVEFFSSLGLFTPVVHLLFTCRAVEAAAADERRPAAARQPSKKACAGHAMLSFATLAVILVVLCHDRYPLKAQSRCSPCECDGTVLTSCRLANVARTWSLDLSDKGITEVRPGAMQDVKLTLYNLWLSDNPIKALPRDVFGGLDVLVTLSLMRTGITELPCLANKKYFENLFLDGMNISSVPEDTLAGSKVRFVHATNMPHFVLDAATFAQARHLEAVWVGGSPKTTCVALPHAAACVDHQCRFVEELTAESFLYRIFKKGTCESSYDGKPGCGEMPCFPQSCMTPS